MGKAFAMSKSNFSTDRLDNFTLHTYASFDPMADVSFIIETTNKLVIIEPQAFNGKVEEFVAYTKKLGKSIDKVLVSFHFVSLNVYKDEQKVITKSMNEFMKSDTAKNMLDFFDKTFKGTMDTKLIEFDQQIDATATFVVDGVAYKLEPTSVPGMPGVNIAIGDKVYYQHFAPVKGFHASQNQITSKDAINGTLTDAIKARQANYKLLLGSHGYGKADTEDLEFQINYLETMKEIAEEVKSADGFIAEMMKKYPDCQGEEDLKGIAAKIYK